MKKTCFSALITLALAASGSLALHAEDEKPLDLRVMTFNIRNGRAKDGENHWEHRKDLVRDVIRQYAPDLLGLQEAFRFQMDDFNRALPEYGEIGIGRDGGTEGEYSAILYRKQRFDVKESGTFWLSDTPTKPSKHWGNDHHRICTWARLTDKETGRSFYMYNTHLDHQSQPAREKGVRLIVKTIRERTTGDPVILTGDFNAGENNPVVAYVKGKGKATEQSPVPFVDSFRMLHPDEEVVGTGNGFQGRSNGPKIDYIFIMPAMRAVEAAIVRTNREGRYPSDHFPVTAQLHF